MRTEGKLIQCDYPNCNVQVMLSKIGEVEADGGYTKYGKFEPLPEGWGYKDGKDLCPDHHQYYLDMVNEFWNPPVGQHAQQDIDELAEMLEADNTEQAADDMILYTNMPEMNVHISSPNGTIDGHTKEAW